MSTPTSERESQNNTQTRIDSQKTHENGGLPYRPNYSEDRDWSFRPREFGRDERDYRYRQKRDWEYRPTAPPPTTPYDPNRSPKRRKLEEKHFNETPYYKGPKRYHGNSPGPYNNNSNNNNNNNYSSNGNRSPSPPSRYDKESRYGGREGNGGSGGPKPYYQDRFSYRRDSGYSPRGPPPMRSPRYDNNRGGGRGKPHDYRGSSSYSGRDSYDSEYGNNSRRYSGGGYSDRDWDNKYERRDRYDNNNSSNNNREYSRDKSYSPYRYYYDEGEDEKSDVNNSTITTTTTNSSEDLTKINKSPQWSPRDDRASTTTTTTTTPISTTSATTINSSIAHKLNGSEILNNISTYIASITSLSSNTSTTSATTINSVTTASSSSSSESMKVEDSPSIETPTPKKRLGWGQGLVAFEKAKNPASEAPDTPDLKNEIVSVANLNSQQMQLMDPPKLLSCETSTNTFTTITTTTTSTPFTQIDNTMSMESITSVPLSRDTSVESNDELFKPEPSFEDIKPIETVKIEEPKVVLPSKEEVLLNIEKVDAEISKTESQIHNLKKPKKVEHKHSRGHAQNIVDRIYEENKEKIVSSQEELISIMPPNLFPINIYKSPSDLPIYQENIKKHSLIKDKIKAILSERKKQLAIKEEKLKEKYKKLYDIWQKKVEKLEAQRKKAQLKKEENKQDPTLYSSRRPIVLRSNARLTRGRLGVSDAVRSEAEFDEIMLQLRDEENHDPNKYLKTLATIPPMILEEDRVAFVDNNGLVEDPVAVERERKQLFAWSDDERQLFLKKFLLYSKNFSKISTFLENKTTEDVIWFYYMNKKTLDLKKLMRDQQTQARRRSINKKEPLPPGMPRELRGLGLQNTFWNPSSPSFSSYERRSSTQKPINYVEDPPPNQNSKRPSLLNASSTTTTTTTVPSSSANNNSASEQDTSVPSTTTRWNDSERDLIIEALQIYQKDWKAIAQHVGSKSAIQCKSFYQNFNKKLNLDKHIDKGNKPKKVTEKETKKKVSPTTPIAKSIEKSPKIEEKKLTITTTTSTITNSEIEKSPVLGERPSTPKITDKEQKRNIAVWVQEEKDAFLKYFAMFGKDFRKIATYIPTKTSPQIKNYFQNYKYKLKLDELLKPNSSDRSTTTPSKITPNISVTPPPTSALEEGKKRGRKQTETSNAVVAKKKKKVREDEEVSVKSKSKDEDSDYEDEEYEEEVEEEEYEQKPIKKDRREEMTLSPSITRITVSPTSPSLNYPRRVNVESHSTTTIKSNPIVATVPNPLPAPISSSSLDTSNDSDLFLASALAMLAERSELAVRMPEEDMLMLQQQQEEEVSFTTTTTTTTTSEATTTYVVEPQERQVVEEEVIKESMSSEAKPQEITVDTTSTIEQVNTSTIIESAVEGNNNSTSNTEDVVMEEKEISVILNPIVEEEEEAVSTSIVMEIKELKEKEEKKEFSPLLSEDINNVPTSTSMSLIEENMPSSSYSAPDSDLSMKDVVVVVQDNTSQLSNDNISSSVIIDTAPHDSDVVMEDLPPTDSNNKEVQHSEQPSFPATEVVVENTLSSSLSNVIEEEHTVTAAVLQTEEEEQPAFLVYESTSTDQLVPASVVVETTSTSMDSVEDESKEQKNLNVESNIVIMQQNEQPESHDSDSNKNNQPDDAHTQVLLTANNETSESSLVPEEINNGSAISEQTSTTTFPENLESTIS